MAFDSNAVVHLGNLFNPARRTAAADTARYDQDLEEFLHDMGPIEDDVTQRLIRLESVRNAQRARLKEVEVFQDRHNVMAIEDYKAEIRRLKAMILVPDSQGQLSLEDYEALESDLEHSKAITSAKDDELQAKDAKLKQLEQHVETLQREITNNATRIQSLVNEKTDVTNKLINSQAAEIQTLSLLREREIELAKSSKVAQEATAVVQSKEALLANLAMENAEATKKLLQDYTKTLDGKENLLSDLATKNAEAIAKLQHDHATALTELEQEHQQALRALRARGDEDTEALEQLQHEYARVRGINTNWTNSTLVLLYRVLGDLKLSTDWPSESEDTDVWFKNRLEEYLQGRIIEAEAHNRVWRYAEERLARIDELQQQNKELKQLLELANKLMTTYKKALD